jgi:hypothetical protein
MSINNYSLLLLVSFKMELHAHVEKANAQLAANKCSNVQNCPHSGLIGHPTIYAASLPIHPNIKYKKKK